MQPLILLVVLGLLLMAIAQRVAMRPLLPSPPTAAPALRAKPVVTAPAAPLRPEAVAPAAAPEDEAMRARLRDRYVAARFPGVVSSPAALADTEEVITTARLLFEEDRYYDAQELLQLAIAQARVPLALELERLEITFLHRDTARYVLLARQFRAAYPDSREWADVTRLGRALARTEPLFLTGQPEHQPHDHYGPWPNTPNWIHASWDLTPDVLATEFHQAMRTQCAKGAAA